MAISTLLLLLAIGIVSGAFAGLLGIGGGIILIPALVFFMGMGQQTAQGTSLAMMLPPIGILAAFNYYKAGQVNIKYALILAVAFIAGSYFGSKIAVNISPVLMKRVFGVIMLIVAVKMLLSK
jgi:uncharacterized membrane protein YfcA